jgi:hypothetical protein
MWFSFVSAVVVCLCLHLQSCWLAGLRLYSELLLITD